MLFPNSLANGAGKMSVALFEKTQAGLRQKKAELAALIEQLQGLKAPAQ